MPVEAIASSAIGTSTMEITISKFELLRELAATQGVVERKTTIPILSNYLFEAGGDRCLAERLDQRDLLRAPIHPEVDDRPGFHEVGRVTPVADHREQPGDVLACSLLSSTHREGMEADVRAQLERSGALLLRGLDRGQGGPPARWMPICAPAGSRPRRSGDIYGRDA